MIAQELLLACAIDAAIGDPEWIPHPVRIMGQAIIWSESHIRRFVSRPISLRLAGMALAIGLPSAAATAGWALIMLGTGVHEWAGWGIGLYLASTTLAWRDLVDHVGGVSDSLAAGSLSCARDAVSLIVGRDTESLSEEEVVRATVETISESASDGVVAPLLYLALGGPPLALAYKAVNTLDSMVGHRDDRYREFGWASARLDDVMNWVPARVTAWLIVVAAWISRRSLQVARRSATILFRDGHKHPSPNSGRPEAAMAGALGVQLGGVNYYEGSANERPRLGDDLESLSARHITSARQIVTVAYVLAIGGVAGYLWL